METIFLVKLFGPTFARILFAYALRGKVDLDFIGSGDIAETLAESLNIDGIVDGLTSGDRKARLNATYIFEMIGDEVAETVATIFEADNQALTPAEQEEVVEAAKVVMNRQALPLLIDTGFELSRFQQELRRLMPENTGFWSEKQTAFYKRLLDISSNYLFAAAERIPHFTRDTTAQLLQDNHSLLEGMRQGLENQEQILKQTYGHQQQTQHQRFEADYRTQLASALDELKMFGIPRLDGARQPLTVAFVQMELAHTAQEGEDPAQLSLFDVGEDKALAKREARYRNLYQADRDKTLSVSDAFANSRRLVVVARAGFGKTTLLKWAAVQIARNMPDVDVPLWQNRLPFFVQLRDYIHRELPAIADLPFGLVDKKPITLLKGSEPDGWALEQVRAKRAVIFLDGLDEINEEKRQDALHWVENILECEPNTVMILSGRPSAIDREKIQPELADLGFQFVTLRPMDEAMTLAFVEHWHEAIAHPNSKYPDKAQVPKRKEHLLAAFSSRRELQDLAETPLVCAMLCALNLTELKELPQDRIRLYERCVDLMLTRDEARAVDVSDYGHPLRPASVQKHLGRIAYWMMENEQSTIQKKDAVQLINSEDLDGPQTVRYLTERSGLLQKQSEDVFDFLHRTFQEFLAAKYIVLRNEARKVARSYAGKKMWRETICFVGGVLMEPADQYEVLDILLTKAKEDEEQAWSLHLLAWEFWQMLDQGTSKANEMMQQHVMGLCENNSRSLFLVHVPIQKLPALAALTNLESFYMMYAQVADVSPLTSLTNLESLTLSGTQVADVTPLAALTKLQSLTLSGTQVSDVSPLAALTNLESLNLSGTQVADVRSLAALTNLESLDLSGTQVADVSPLAALTNLQSLDLSGTQVADVSPLAALTNLESLNLSGTQVADVSPLATLTNLESLYLSGTQVADVSPLTALTNLQSLYLSGTQVTDVSPLAALTNLQSLDLMNTQVTNFSALAQLIEAGNLKLYFSEKQLTKHLQQLAQYDGLRLVFEDIEDLNHLRTLTNLQSLDLSGTQVADVSPLVVLTNLESLTLRGTQVSDVSPLAALTKLQSLDLIHTQVSDVSPLTTLTKLQSLNLMYTQVADISPLAVLTNLESLDLSGTQVADVSPLAALTNLESLDLSGTQVADVSPLAALTKLQSLNLMYTQVADTTMLDHNQSLRVFI